MASLVQSMSFSSAAGKRSASLPLRLGSSHFVAPSRAYNTFSTLCSRSRSTQLQYRVRSCQSPRAGSKFITQQSRTFLSQLKQQGTKQKETKASLTSANAENTESTSSKETPLQLTNLPYFVRRTPSNQLPVYLVTKAGGTKQQTKIQKTEGDLEALRSDLSRALGLESGDSRGKKSPDVTINRLNGHIIVKGWRKPEIQKFLLERNFWSKKGKKKKSQLPFSWTPFSSHHPDHLSIHDFLEFYFDTEQPNHVVAMDNWISVV